ncbi:MAG: hypothetical protein RMK18_08475 [Armatimonadota bacterium]|nr:hypothetical protein [Armatimonadota bacterium]MCX7777708.1 hypothetical protein [Armatimonadota bacterium]MDW8025877.1 hypothetical protein [Armatimonadota bacterium]
MVHLLSVCILLTLMVIAMAQPLEQPRNLVRNSHFWYSENGQVPDWWGTGAPERIRLWKDCISLSYESPVKGVRSLRLFNPQAGTSLNLQSYAYILPSGKPYTFSVYMRTESGELPVRLSIGYDQTTTVRVTTQWQRFSFAATPNRGHWAKGRLVVGISFSDAGALFIAAPQLEEGDAATDYTPLYRDDAFIRMRSQLFRALVQLNAYVNEPTMRLWCESNLPLSVKVRCRVNELELTSVGDPSLNPMERKFLSFAIGELQAGTHQLLIEAVDEQGKVVAKATDALVKLPPAEGIGCLVQVDRVRRHILLNGKPKILFAQGIHANPQDWWLDDIAQNGFNSIVAFIPTSGGAVEQVRKFLDDVHRRKLSCVAWLRPQTGQRPASAIADDIANTIKALRSHPAIVIWYLLDEPEGWWAQGGRKEEELLTVYKAAKASDPYRPAQLNWYSWTDGKGGYGSLSASDFGSLDHYPFGRTENPFTRLCDFLWRMNRDCRPLGKPVAFWQQMYGYDDAVREPTAEEARAHTWLTITTGGRLIYWFIYKPMGEKFWASMPQIAKEVEQLEGILTADDAVEVAVGREKSVYYSIWARNDGHFLLAVNASYTNVRVPLFLRWLTQSTVKQLEKIIGDGNATVRDDVLWLELPPLGACAFKM